MKTFENDTYKPYGAADQFCMDQYIEDGFEGNVLDALITKGFSVSPEQNALGHYDLIAPSGTVVASLDKKI